MSYLIILQIGELSNSDGRYGSTVRAQASAGCWILYRPTQIARAHSRTKRRKEEERGGARAGKAWDGTRSGRIKHRQVCTKRASITAREETMRTTRKTTHTGARGRTDGQHQSRGRNMERNLRKEFTWSFICCVILLLVKAKACFSFIPQSSTIFFSRPGSCGRRFIYPRPIAPNRPRESREGKFSSSGRFPRNKLCGKRQEMSFICIPNRDVQARTQIAPPQKKENGSYSTTWMQCA